MIYLLNMELFDGYYASLPKGSNHPTAPNFTSYPLQRRDDHFKHMDEHFGMPSGHLRVQYTRFDPNIE